MSDRPFISHFSPQRTDPELLEQIHVQRHELLAESVALIRESVLTENKHHLLFIGPRGVGKTHLVRLIHYRLGQQADLGDKMRFAWLNEDETATSFLKLLILIYRDVSQRYPQEFPLEDLQGVYGLGVDVARERLGKRLLKHLGSHTLVVLMENLDSLFKHMPEGEQRTWRAFVQNHPVFATVGTAQSLFDDVADRKQPFFGFFDTRHLTPLDVQDAIQLLKKIAHLNDQQDLVEFLDTPSGHARVQAIHDLAGGNPRIYLIFSDFLTPESLDDLVRPFEETADRQLTSYYQERLRWLSPQQQEIIQFLCHQRQPVPVKNIAEGLFTTHNSITAQLRQLKDFRYLKANQSGREVFYELAEPLMRLALQIKDTHDRRPLSLIVDFLRVWYDREEIVRRLDVLGPENAARCYFEEALKRIDSGEPNLRHLLLRQILGEVDLLKCDDAKLNVLRSLAKETGNVEDWAKLSLALSGRGEFTGMVESINHVLEARGVPFDVAALLLAMKAVALGQLGCHDEALRDIDAALNLSQTPIEPMFFLYFTRGSSFLGIGDYNGAIADFDSVIKDADAHSVIVTESLRQRASAFRAISRFDDAVADLNQVIEDSNANSDVRLRAFWDRVMIYLLRGDLGKACQEARNIRDMSGMPEDLRMRSLLLIGGFSEDINEVLQSYRGYFEMLVFCDPKLVPVPGINLFQSIVKAIYDSGEDAWKKLILEFVGNFSENDLMSACGDSLIHHLSEMKAGLLGSADYEAWWRHWSATCSQLKAEDQAKMEIPLRLLHAGIEYLKSTDEGVLLALPVEERKILREVLQLPPEKTT